MPIDEGFGLIQQDIPNDFDPKNPVNVEEDEEQDNDGDET